MHPEVFQLFPGMRIAVAVVRGVDNRVARPQAAAEWQRAWAGAAAMSKDYPNAQSHPHVGAWRDAWKRAGISHKKFPSSIEALFRRALRGGEPFSINPLVDFYNALSLEHVVPAGGFDLGALLEVQAGGGARLELRPTVAGDTFQALDQESPGAVPPGEIAYTAGSTVLTRHLVWRQARTALIVPETRDAILVSEVLGELDRTLAERLAQDFALGLRRYFGVEASTFVVDEESPALERS